MNNNLIANKVVNIIANNVWVASLVLFKFLYTESSTRALLCCVSILFVNEYFGC